MASLLSRGIHPSFHAIVALLVLVVLGCGLAYILISEYPVFQAAQQERARYHQDCANAPRSAGPISAPCYTTDALVVYDMGDFGAQSTTLYADINGYNLHATRVAVLANFNQHDIPNANGSKSGVQIWRDRATKIRIESKWYLTEDSPDAKIGALQISLIALATVVAWAITILTALLLIKGARGAKQVG